MKSKSPRSNSLWLITAVGLLAILLLFGLAALPHQPAAHAQQAPREILVNAVCSNQVDHEHIRFGLESSHYYKFLGKTNNWYEIKTTIYKTNQDGITVDTRLILYRHNPLEHPGQPILAQNDDTNDPSGGTHQMYSSLIEYRTLENDYYWVEVQNMRPGGEGSYCLEVKLKPDGPSIVDKCEPNDTFEQACEIQLQAQIGENEGKVPEHHPTTTVPSGDIPDPQGKTIFNFAPLSGSGPDQDYFKVWVKAGERYTCETYNLSQVNDTAMTLYNQHRVVIGSNEDTAIANRASKVQHVNSTYTGWMYIHVRPVIEINYDYAHYYTYQLKCTRGAAPIDNYVPPPPPPANSGTGQATLPEEAEEAVAAIEVTPAAPAVGPVAFVALSQPVATATPDLPSRSLSFTIHVYYDRNDNQSKDPDEGIANLPIYIYTDSSDKPLQTTTSQGGAVIVGLETSSPSVQLVIPYLGVNQEIPVRSIQDVHVRVAP